MNRLKELRIQNNIYQKDIAKYLNIGQTGYSKYETGKIDIPTDVLKRLSKYYNVSIDYILCMTDEQKPYKKSLMELESDNNE